MRCFRLYQRSMKTGRIIKHRDYVGLENLQKYAKKTYDGYDAPNSTWWPTTAELAENIAGKWRKLSIEQTLELLCVKEQ